MNEIHNIISDIRARRHLESYFIVVVSIIILILDILGDKLTQSILNEAILATLSVLVYATILERREYMRAVARNQIEGISAFETTRTKLSPLPVHFDRARKEIALLGVQLDTVVHQCLNLLQRKAEAGCTIRILMMSPQDENGNVNSNVKEFESRWQYRGLQAKLETNRDIFEQWLAALPSRAKRRVEIRYYPEHPISNYLIIDQDESSGYVQVEPMAFYKIDPADSPHYIVRKAEDERFFQLHTESFERRWQKSRAFSSKGEYTPPTRPPPPHSKTSKVRETFEVFLSDQAQSLPEPRQQHGSSQQGIHRHQQSVKIAAALIEAAHYIDDEADDYKHSKQQSRQLYHVDLLSRTSATIHWLYACRQYMPQREYSLAAIPSKSPKYRPKKS